MVISYAWSHPGSQENRPPGAPWWRHQMETFSALLAICAENSPVPGEFPAQRSVTRSFDVFFDLRLNKRLSKQSWGWWFETLLRSLWRHRNAMKETTNSKVLILLIIDLYLPLKFHIPINFSLENYFADCIVIAKIFFDLAKGTVALIFMARCSYWLC